VWNEVQTDIQNDEAWPNIATVFDDSWSTIATKLGEPTAIESLITEIQKGVDLIPAHPGLDSLDADLGTIDDATERYSRLDSFLTEYIDPLGYDFLLIDLPGLSNNVTYN
ncbi:MAG: ParA family protein, partial [Halobacteriaceae archaeon]